MQAPAVVCDGWSSDGGPRGRVICRVFTQGRFRGQALGVDSNGSGRLGLSEEAVFYCRRQKVSGLKRLSFIHAPMGERFSILCCSAPSLCSVRGFRNLADECSQRSRGASGVNHTRVRGYSGVRNKIDAENCNPDVDTLCCVAKGSQP